MKIDLAEECPDGSVWLCGRCEDVRVRWENLAVTLTRARFEKFARLAESAGRRLGQLRAPVSDPRPALSGEKTWLQ
jgi:hypothetical protein